MSGVLQNIDPPTPHRPASVYPPPPPAFGAGGGHTRWVERGWGVKSLEGAKHCSVLSVLTYINIRKYFVAVTITSYVGVQYRSAISGRGEGSHIMGVQESHIWERGGFPRYGSTGVPYLRDGRFPTIWEYRSPISERGEVSHDMGVQESHI